jgi:hypothetical protein
MNDEWKSYPNDRKILHKDGYSVIVPASFDINKIESMPIFCGVCSIRFGNSDDEFSYKKFKCCNSCADQWAYSNKEKWLAGWRPSKEQIEAYIEKRYFSNNEIRFI